MKKISFLFALLCASVMGWATVYDDTELVLDAGETSNQTITLSICKSGDNTTRVVAKSTTSVFTGVYECIWQGHGGGTSPVIGDYTVTDHEISFETTWATYPTSATQLRFVARRNNTGGGSDIFGGTATNADVTVECASGECTDAEKPVVSAVAVSSITYNSAVLTITASDNVGVKSYIVKNGDTQIKTSTSSPITLTGLTANTTYSNIKVIAKDACDNESNPFAVDEFKTAERASQCSGDLGHFGNPSVKRISYTIAYIPSLDKIRYTVQGYDTQVLDYLEVQTTSGNSGAVTITDGVAVWQQAAPAAGTEIGILFLYSTDAIGGNEMNAESCSIDKNGIVYYRSHDCESSEPEPEPEEIYNVNFALKTNGASATAKSGNNAEEAIDNNTGSRWYSATADMTDEEKNDQWWQVDLGERRIFNLVQILWEGAWGKSFDIQKSDDGTNWTTIKEIRDQNIPGPFPYLQEIELASHETARYIRFQGIARGTGYSYSFWEFRVYLVGERVLSSLELSAAHILTETDPKVALAPTTGGIELTVAGKDQVGAPIDAGEYVFEFEGEFVGIVDEGKLKSEIGGPGFLTAKNGNVVSNTLHFYGYEGENVSLGKEVEASSAQAGNPAANAVDNNEGSLWSALSGETGSEREYDAWIIVDLGAFYDINLIALRWEGACSKHYHVDFSEDKANWRTAYNAGWNAVATHWEYLFDTEVDATKVRYVRVYSTEATSQYGIKLMDLKVFGIPYVPAGDNVKPVMGEAELVSKSWNSAVIAVSATDNEEIGKYHVVDAENEFDDTFVPSADDKITVTGLAPSTTYNFTITAIDLSSNESDNSASVNNVKTEGHLFAPDAAAADPIVPAAQVLALYSATYEATCNFSDWGSGATFNDEYGKKCINNPGGWFGLVDFGTLDCTNMEKLHADIWIENDASLRITPIRQIWNESEGKYVNDTEYGDVANLTGQQWNSVELSLSEDNMANANNWERVYQLKFDQVTNLTFWVNNVYFFKEEGGSAIDNAAEAVKAQKVVENGQLIIIKNGIRYNVAGQKVQ